MRLLSGFQEQVVTKMRKSLFFVVLTISLMAALAVSIFTVLQERESAQVAAAVINPPATQLVSSVGLKAVNKWMAEGPLGTASATYATDPYSNGDDGSGIKADHDGVCPFKNTQLRDSEL